MMDLSPVNLHPFAQQGFDTTVGNTRTVDARTGRHRLDAAGDGLLFPNDDITTQVTAAIRAANAKSGGGPLPLCAEHGRGAEGGSGRGCERRSGSGAGNYRRQLRRVVGGV